MVNYNATRLALLVSDAETATTNRTKGESFANLVEHMFAEVPGVALAKRGHLDANRAAEIDLIFRHNPLSSGLPFEGVTVFIECKNEARKIGAAQVRNFGSKLRRRNQRYGVMVSRMGLSGKRATAGHAAISEELAQGRSIVVLCLNDVRALTSTDDFLELLHDRLTELHIETTYTSI